MSDYPYLETTGLRVITSPVTYYISPTGNDSNDGLTPSTAKFTLNSVFDELKDKRIATDTVVTINVLSGVYNYNTQQVISHPGGKNIVIYFDTSQDHTVDLLSVDTITSNGTGDHLITYNVSGDLTSFNVGDYIEIYPDGDYNSNTGPFYLHYGFWEVTNVDAGNAKITVRNTCQRSSFPSGATFTSGVDKITRRGTLFKFSGVSEKDCVLIHGSEIIIHNFAAVTNPSDKKKLICLRNHSVMDFSRLCLNGGGLHFYDGSLCKEVENLDLLKNNLIVCNAGEIYGALLIDKGSTLICDGCIVINGNSDYGLIAHHGSQFYYNVADKVDAFLLTFSGNVHHGIHGNESNIYFNLPENSVIASNIFTCYNGWCGIDLRSNAAIEIWGSSSLIHNLRASYNNIHGLASSNETPTSFSCSNINIYTDHNSGYGIQIAGGHIQYLKSCQYNNIGIGNSRPGTTYISGSSSSYGYIANNSTAAIQCWDMSRLIIRYVNIVGNVNAYNRSTIRILNYTISGSFSPTPNTWGNNGSMIVG